MAARAEVLIVGGGVIGLTSAYFLAKEGLSVQLLDQSDLGQEASWAGAGILTPGDFAQAATPFDCLRSWSCQEYPRLSRELLDATGIDNGYWRCGGLEFTEPTQGLPEEEWHGRGATAELISPHGLPAWEPELACNLGGARFFPDMAQVRNPRHLKALIAAAANRGVHFEPGVRLERFMVSKGLIQGLETNRGPRHANHYVLAIGAWTDRLTSQLGWRPGIKPIRGQIALVRPRVSLVKRILLWGNRYLVPRGDGPMLIGSTEEDVGFIKENTPGAIAELLKMAIRLLPGLADAPIERSWSGLRPGSPDGLPFIGKLPSFGNLVVAAGHFRAGIQLAPATARLVTDLILNRNSSLPMGAFALMR